MPNGNRGNFNIDRKKPYVDTTEKGVLTRTYGSPEQLKKLFPQGKIQGAGGTQQKPQDNTTATDAKPAGEETPKADTNKVPVPDRGETQKADTNKVPVPDRDGTKASPTDKKSDKTFNVNGKEMTRNDINKRLNALLKKARAGQPIQAGINFKSTLGKMLHEQLSSAEQKELQGIIDAVKDSRYYQVFLNRDKTLQALQDAGIKNIPDKPAKREKPKPQKSVRKYYKKDPKTGKEVEIDKDEADAMAKRANVGTGDDDDFDSTFNRIKAKAQGMSGNTQSSSTSSSTSTVTRTGGSSTTTTTSGGGSTTRFAKVMRATDETKKLRAEKEKIENKMDALGDKSDGFGYTQSPEYKKLKKELETYTGIDGKIAKSKEMVHPAGIIKNGKITYFNPKGGKPMKWDGEQYDPKRKNDMKDSVDMTDQNRLIELAGIKSEPKLDYDIVDDTHVHMRNDKDFYRQKYFPTMCKMAELHKSSKSFDPKLIIMPLVNDGVNSYCKKYNMAKMPDEVFKDDHRKALYDKIYSEEIKEIEKGEYA